MPPDRLDVRQLEASNRPGLRGLEHLRTAPHNGTADKLTKVVELIKGQLKSSQIKKRNKKSPSPPRTTQKPHAKRDFVKLNINKAHILAILKEGPGDRPPRPMNPNRPPSTRFCNYHDDTWHMITRCYQLKNLIKHKVQSGELSHLAVKDDSTHRILKKGYA
ncbi:hypothetical protein AgCh_010160 [Apium graveolens]